MVPNVPSLLFTILLLRYRFVNIWIGLQKRKNVTKIKKYASNFGHVIKIQILAIFTCCLAKNMKMRDFEQDCYFNKTTNYKHFT